MDNQPQTGIAGMKIGVGLFASVDSFLMPPYSDKIRRLLIHKRGESMKIKRRNTDPLEVNMTM